MSIKQFLAVRQLSPYNFNSMQRRTSTVHCITGCLPAAVHSALGAPSTAAKMMTPAMYIGVEHSRRSRKNKKNERLFRKLALVGIILDQIIFSLNSDKDRRTDSRERLSACLSD